MSRQTKAIKFLENHTAEELVEQLYNGLEKTTADEDVVLYLDHRTDNFNIITKIFKQSEFKKILSAPDKEGFTMLMSLNKKDAKLRDGLNKENSTKRFKSEGLLSPIWNEKIVSRV